MAPEQEVVPIYFLDSLYTFNDEPPKDSDGTPMIFSGFAQSGTKREKSLKRFANGDSSVIVYHGQEYVTPVRLTDSRLVRWPVGYKDE